MKTRIIPNQKYQYVEYSVTAGTTSRVAAPDRGTNYPNFINYFGDLAA